MLLGEIYRATSYPNNVTSKPDPQWLLCSLSTVAVHQCACRRASSSRGPYPLGYGVVKGYTKRPCSLFLFSTCLFFVFILRLLLTLFPPRLFLTISEVGPLAPGGGV